MAKKSEMLLIDADSLMDRTETKNIKEHIKTSRKIF